MGKVSPKTLNFHVQASCWIRERLAFNAGSLENNQKKKKRPTKTRHLNQIHLVLLPSVSESWEDWFCFRESLTNNYWTAETNILISHMHQSNKQMATLRTILCYYSRSLFLIIWSWIYKDRFHFIVYIITPKRLPISNK